MPLEAPDREAPTTTRLACERLDDRHLEDLVRLHADERVMATLAGTRSADETREFLERERAHWSEHGFGLWALRLRDRGSGPGRFVGRGGLRHNRVEGEPVVELAYAIDAGHWGRGLATELAEAALAVGFHDVGLEELHGFTMTTNRGSRRVMEKAGFRYQRDFEHVGLPHRLYRLRAAERGEPRYAIRLARAEEIGALPEIERAASLLFHDTDFAPGVLADVTPEASLAEAQRTGLLWVAVGPGSRPVGFALAQPLDGCAHLDEVDVHPAHGRRGLGAALVRVVCEGARRRGLAGVTLTTFRELPWNAPFYRGLGFRALAAEELTPGLVELFRDEDEDGLPASQRFVMRFDVD